MLNLTTAVLLLVLIAAALYAAYWVIRKAVAHGIRDARHAEARVGSGQDA